MLIKEAEAGAGFGAEDITDIFPQHELMVVGSGRFIRLRESALSVMITNEEGDILPHDPAWERDEHIYRVFIHRASNPDVWVPVKGLAHRASGHLKLAVRVCEFMDLIMIRMRSGEHTMREMLGVREMRDYVAIKDDIAYKLPASFGPFIVTGERVYTPGVGPGGLISPEIFPEMKKFLMCCRRRNIHFPCDIRILLAQIFTEIAGWRPIGKI